MVRTFRPSFATASVFETAPFLGKICKSIDCIFIPRGGTEESRN